MEKFTRVRLKHLMIALAVLTVMVELTGIGPRWRRYYRLTQDQKYQTGQYLLVARQHEDLAARLRDEARRAGELDPGKPVPREIEAAENQADGFRQLAGWSEEIRRNYQHALYRPWAVAAPDPPFIRQ